MNIQTPVHRRWPALAALVLSLLLGACAAPATSAGDSPATNPVAPDAAAAPDTTAPAPRPSQLPPVKRPIQRPPPGAGLPGNGDAGTGGGVLIDRSCSTDADCTVKNVGNCCGHYPACVNVDSPTDPEGVQAACAKSGMASVCGFPSITSCQCVQGTCQGDSRVLLD
jgi:hypothetical protein